MRPVVTAFTRTYPRCQVELSLSDRLVDVQTVDLAIRVGWLRDSSVIVRRIGTMAQCLVCSAERAPACPCCPTIGSSATWPRGVCCACFQNGTWRVAASTSCCRRLVSALQGSVDFWRRW